MEMQNFSRWPPRPQIEETRYINGTQEHAIEKPPAVPDPGDYPCDDTISTESPPSYDFEPQPPPPAQNSDSEEIPETKPPNHLGMSLLNLVCCFPLGVAAMICTIMVNYQWNVDHYAAAAKASDRAKLFNSIGILTGATLIISAVLLTILNLL